MQYVERPVDKVLSVDGMAAIMDEHAGDFGGCRRMVISRHKSSFPRLGKWRAAPGGPPRRWAARPARRRRPRPAAALGLALCAARRSPPVIKW